MAAFTVCNVSELKCKDNGGENGRKKEETGEARWGRNDADKGYQLLRCA
jgi:hypothetical protein